MLARDQVSAIVVRESCDNAIRAYPNRNVSLVRETGEIFFATRLRVTRALSRRLRRAIDVRWSPEQLEKVRSRRFAVNVAVQMLERLCERVATPDKESTACLVE